MTEFSLDLANNLVVALINALGISLIYIVLRSNYKSRLSQIFVLMTLLMFIWVDFAFLARIPNQVDHSLLWIRIAWAITPFLFVLVYSFIIRFSQVKSRLYRIGEMIFFATGLLFFVLTLFSSWIIKGIQFDSAGVLQIIYGDLVFTFFGAVFALTIVSFFVLIRRFKKSKGKERQRFRLLFLGMLFFFLMNSIFNIYLPVFEEVVHLYYFGDYSTIVFLSLIALAIVRHRMFNVKVIAAELLTFAIWIIVSIELFTATTWGERLVKLIIFGVTIAFGILLIRSVKKEIEQKEELARMTKKLERANKELRRLDKAKTEFISIASHQLRTPLTVTKGFISLLLEDSYGKLKKDVREVLTKVYRSNENLILLVEDLLNISRIESGRMKYEYEEIQLEDMLEGINDIMSEKAREKGLKLNINYPKTKLPKLKIDRSKVREVVTNFVDNAIKYTDKGHVDVDFKKTKQKVQIIVSDTGIGIPKTELPHLFKKFSRGKDTKRLNATGTGLGLFVGKKIIEAHGGTVWAESKGEGKGSKFIIELPIKNLKAEAVKNKSGKGGK